MSVTRRTRFLGGVRILLISLLVSLRSDLSKEALIIKMYQVTCILVYLLKEHIHVTTSIKQHIHALFCDDDDCFYYYKK